MDWIDKLSAALTTKAMAATSVGSAVGGVAAERVPILAEAVLFHAFGYGVTMAAIAMSVAILSGLWSIFRGAIIAGLRRVFG